MQVVALVLFWELCFDFLPEIHDVVTVSVRCSVYVPVHVCMCTFCDALIRYTITGTWWVHVHVHVHVHDCTCTWVYIMHLCTEHSMQELAWSVCLDFSSRGLYHYATNTIPLTLHRTPFHPTALSDVFVTPVTRSSSWRRCLCPNCRRCGEAERVVQ